MLDTPQLMGRQLDCYDAAMQELERRIARQEFGSVAAERRAPGTLENLRGQRERLAEALALELSA